MPWVNIGNKSIGAYDVVLAKGELEDPQWPDHGFKELIGLAFRDKLIDSMEHAVVKEIDGVI
jgi:hypothetical protein